MSAGTLLQTPLPPLGSLLRYTPDPLAGFGEGKEKGGRKGGKARRVEGNGKRKRGQGVRERE